MRGRATRYGPSERPRDPGPDRQRWLRVRLLHSRAALPPEPRPRVAARPAACCHAGSCAAFPLGRRPSPSVRLRPSPPRHRLGSATLGQARPLAPETAPAPKGPGGAGRCNPGAGRWGGSGSGAELCPAPSRGRSLTMGLSLRIRGPRR